jgi:ribosomal protein S18 acetylase RimI-like enzyme
MRREELPLAAGVAARGMRDNPSSVALFGPDPVRRVRDLEPLYHWVLSAQQRPTLVARRNGVIIGLAALSPPGQCFYRQIEAGQRALRVGTVRVGIPSVPGHLLLPLLRLGPGALSRLSQWGEMGFQHDPPESHQHVELVVVEAALQGLGIGSRLMEELCREIDSFPQPAYLETDKPENVPFYERFGFGVIGEATALGTRNWFMSRPASG